MGAVLSSVGDRRCLGIKADNISLIGCANDLLFHFLSFGSLGLDAMAFATVVLPEPCSPKRAIIWILGFFIGYY
jgi:hypothetical protein